MKTYCNAISANINTSVCPLAKGACYWQHRDSKECKYTEQELSVEEFCERVKAPVPTESTDAFRARLRATL